MTTLPLYELVTLRVGGRTGSGGNQAVELITIFVESYQVTLSPCALNVSLRIAPCLSDVSSAAFCCRPRDIPITLNWWANSRARWDGVPSHSAWYARLGKVKVFCGVDEVVSVTS